MSNNTLKIKRLSKELKELHLKETTNGLVTVIQADNFTEWILQIAGAPNTLYDGETFYLKVPS